MDATDKAIEKLTNAIEQAIKGIGSLGEKYGPEMIDSALWVVKLNGVQWLTAGVVLLGIGFVLMVASHSEFKESQEKRKAWTKYRNEREMRGSAPEACGQQCQSLRSRATVRRAWAPLGFSSRSWDSFCFSTSGTGSPSSSPSSGSRRSCWGSEPTRAGDTMTPQPTPRAGRMLDGRPVEIIGTHPSGALIARETGRIFPGVALVRPSSQSTASNTPLKERPHG